MARRPAALHARDSRARIAPNCIRVLLHVESRASRAKIRHVYLHDARALRPDLAELTGVLTSRLIRARAARARAFCTASCAP